MDKNSFAGRGGWWVAAQVVILIGFVGVTLAERSARGGGGWPAPWTQIGIGLGGLLGLASAALFVMAAAHLGRSLTAFPQPLASGQLVEHGAYRVVRHPIYTSVIGLCLGWALLVNSIAGVLLAFGVLAFFDRKAASEEIMLAGKYPGYAQYRQRVRKLIPFVY